MVSDELQVVFKNKSRARRDASEDESRALLALKVFKKISGFFKINSSIHEYKSSI